MNTDPNVWTRVGRSLLIAFALVLMSASVHCQTEKQSISVLFSKGYFERVATLAPTEIKQLSGQGHLIRASQTAIIACRAYIHLRRFDQASQIVEPFISDSKLRAQSPVTLASAYFCKASIYRAKRNFKASFETLQEAVLIAPQDLATVSGYHLEVGRTLYSAGHDFAAIIWFEKAEREALAANQKSIYFDALRFLSLAWSAKSYYANALDYSEKLVEKSSNGEFEYKNRLAHQELANLLDVTGQKERSTAISLRGLQLSRQAKVTYHIGQFLSALFYRAVYENKIEIAEDYLRELESADSEKQFVYERLLGNALIAHYKGNKVSSDQYFMKLKGEQQTTEFVIPYWKSTIAERENDWEELINQAKFLLKKTAESNFEDDLPGIYYKLALGYWRHGEEKSAREHALKALSLFEPFRNNSAVTLSISMIEVHHSIYRLLSEIDASSNPEKAFEYSERLKASLLRDRIEKSILKKRPDLTESVRSELLIASSRVIEGTDNDDALFKLERSVVFERQENSKKQSDFTLQKLQLPDNTTVVSFQFIPSGHLIAYIIENAKPLRVVKLTVNEVQAAKLASETQTKIKDRIFFKIDGKKLYDLLLKPLDLKSNHLVIVPDKLLWRIPFHALSPDGNKYLIETNTVSYSPSVYLLKQQLSAEPTRRQTIQIFANDTFNRQKLAYVNSEAMSIGKLFGISPRLNATKSHFLKSAAETDILHFSMHAQLDSENPLSSFLAFEQNSADSGRLTVSDLLSVPLKSNNLAFLASCDTSKVHSGEGLLSIPWALLGSGSSTVISSQWEISDKATQQFAIAFYQEYLRGRSTNKALQNAAISMMHDKSSGFHEPYFWGGFNIIGDYR